MSLWLPTGSRVRNVFDSSTRRLLVVVLMVLIAVQTVGFVFAYAQAIDHLRQNDPRELQNRSEVSFFYAPLKLHVGDAVSIADLTAYFGEKGYVESTDQVAGSFFVDGDTFIVSENTTAQRQLTITLNRDLVASLSVAGESARELDLEPLPMQDFIRYLQADSLKAQRVRRTMIAPGAIPELLQDAVICTEDRRFLAHHGIDVFGMVRRVSSRRGGGSSITQQLIKNTIFKGAKGEFWQTYLWFLPDKYQRKATDVFLALAAERLMSKQEILAAYLSVIPLGASEGVELHGAVVASQEYFGKSVSELSIDEAAVLAGMIHQPSEYVGQARAGDYRLLIERRNVVLDLMQTNLPEKYSTEQIEAAKAKPIKFLFASTTATRRPASSYSRQFVELASRSLPPELSQLRSREGTLRIFSTLDFRLQKEATEIAERAVTELRPRIRRVCRKSGMSAEQCAKVTPQVGLVAMGAQTGDVLAMVGGIHSDFNHTTAPRSPGSIGKGLIYLLAIEDGRYHGEPYTAATIIDPRTDELSGYRPTENLGQRSSARIGLAKSYNFHAVSTAHAAGLRQTIDFLARTTNSHPEISGMAALGGTAGSETSLLDLVRAYTLFPSNGKLASVNLLGSCDYAGVTKKLGAVTVGQTADAGAAFIVTNMLRSVVSRQGTAPAFRQLAGLSPEAAVAGKTGTGMVSDLWFIAFTPHFVVGVWVGLDRNEVKLQMRDGFSGASVAAPIVAKFMRATQRVRPELMTGEFERPDNVVELRIDPAANCVRDSGNVKEYFLKGREPLPCSSKR